MPVGEVEAAPALQDKRVVGKHREFQHHLVDLGVAVAAHAHKLRLHGIQHCDDLFRRVPFGKVVARSVVEDIPQQAEPLGALAGVSLQHFLAVKRGAVYIRSKHQFHCSSPYRFSFMSAASR